MVPTNFFHFVHRQMGHAQPTAHFNLCYSPNQHITYIVIRSSLFCFSYRLSYRYISFLYQFYTSTSFTVKGYTEAENEISFFLPPNSTYMMTVEDVTEVGTNPVYTSNGLAKTSSNLF